MNTKTAVRPYQHSDEDAVVDLWARASRQAHPFVEGEGEGERARRLREIYLREADNWVAEEDGAVVGLLGLLGNEVGGLFVAPEAQGRGIGRTLLEHAAALHGGLSLKVYEANARARGFYGAMGFEERGRSTEEETGHPLIVLFRPASPTGPNRAPRPAGPGRD
ncbi:GNAT family N-acetyltransferase [Streptomyces sp. HB2AG]|uniref:GNAT family N-acetyltransferase n=1 Tax=Streptomyces sp. HB2AG TaxID=2983400 RepID=UPI0022AACDB6|nr:GNAT family N-acetyltransferase [Streptomyces sp. HB2AG]MCZ2527106.1 GNAT family N-acetyltransferase [Streptomyces sp. HB2AG]